MSERARDLPDGPPGPLAITGARGRLGRALVTRAGTHGLGWSRPDVDLDDPRTLAGLVACHRPRLVIHAAAMTDVDACARDPDLARRRNADAVAVLAEACRVAGANLVVVSTNEVFSGERDDGRGYVETDAPEPRNAYGASKLAGERAALAAFDAVPGLWIVRTAWLFGPPGDDFPHKIVAAADRLEPDASLTVVADEVGCPTFTLDLAPAILQLVERTAGGVYHLVGPDQASRLDWALEVLARLRPERRTRSIRSRDFQRDSLPPRWAVLDATLAARDANVTLPPWTEALDRYLGPRPDR